jgi:thymidylate synthase
MSAIATKIHPEQQYLNLIRRILNHGDRRVCRNGATLSVFGDQMRFDLRNGVIPILTTKRVAWKTCLKELLWFIRGDTDNCNLKDENVHIWDGNGSREFLDSRGLTDYEEDDLGPIYGFQWRNFNGTYRSCGDYDNDGIDQLMNVVNALKNDGSQPGENKYSRRLLVSAWNPCALDKMALPPCHVMFQFYVNSKDELSCHLYQRSGDVGLGVPFNIASYSFLTYILADFCGLKPGDFVYSLGDCHIYEEHIDALKTQISREPFEFPMLKLKEKKNTVCPQETKSGFTECLRLEDYCVSDFILENYTFHKKIKMNIIV